MSCFLEELGYEVPPFFLLVSCWDFWRALRHAVVEPIPQSRCFFLPCLQFVRIMIVREKARKSPRAWRKYCLTNSTPFECRETLIRSKSLWSFAERDCVQIHDIPTCSCCPVIMTCKQACEQGRRGACNRVTLTDYIGRVHLDTVQHLEYRTYTVEDGDLRQGGL